MTNTPRLVRFESTQRRRAYTRSILISVTLVILLVATLLPRLYNRPFSTLLFTLVLMALATAIALHAHFLIRVRREQRETAGALNTTEDEFQSIFDSALDGLLILDDAGTCLAANPAALNLLAVRRDDLVGHPIYEFQQSPRESECTESTILFQKDGQGETQLTRRDAETIFAEYSVKTNYLPGRHVVVLHDISDKKRAEMALRESDARFQQMADNIQEIFWMLDVETKKAIYVNRAFEAVTGRSRDTLQANPTSYQELLHPEDRDRVLDRLDEGMRTGRFDEEFRIVRSDHSVRWVGVRGFPVRDSGGALRRLVGTAQDITVRKTAESQMARNLALAESASAEADAFRKTTLALTQDLSMDYVLDTLLRSLLQLIPCDSAQILLSETGEHFFLAREIHTREAAYRSQRQSITWDAADHPPLMKVLATRNSLLVANTADMEGWKKFKGHSQFRSWLCVPLMAAQKMIGLLSLGGPDVNAFTQEHLRLAKSLAIPAAVAIQNARLYERAEIYGAELQKRLADLEQTQRALQQAERSRTLSEDKFSKVFRSSPVAFSITTVAEGRFIDVNEAFERLYGYSRDELVGNTVFDLEIWYDPEERSQMLTEIGEHGRIRNHATHYRKRSGASVEIIYSGQVIELDGRQCILAVTEEVPDRSRLRDTPARNAMHAR